MHHEFATWHSPLLGRDMTLQVIGHAGARVLVFPTSMGTHTEWPDRRMHVVLQEQIDRAQKNSIKTADNLTHPVAGTLKVVAEMVAARLFNQRRGQDNLPVSGVVTTGSLWRFMALAGDAVEIRELPPLTTERWQPMELAAPPVAAREFRGQIRRDWGMASFSTLAHGRTEDLPDRDPAERPTEVAVTPPGPLALFRGTRAGTCLHEVFELLDFTQADPVTVQARVEERLRAHGFPPELLSSELTILVGRVLDAELFLGTALRRVPAKACWRELEFLLPLQRLTPASLRAAFSVVPRGGASDAFAASLGRLGFADIEGFLSGFMDLVFQHEGRWWLVDWKSNWLGDSPEAYGPEALEREMLGQHYGLQYHLYLLALHRLLRQRLPNYEYERDVGGAVYVFVRGVTPGRPELGLFRDRPPQRVLDELEVRLLGTSSPEVRR